MILLALALLAQAESPDPAPAIEKGIILPSPEVIAKARGRDHRAVLDLLADPGTWTRALRALNDRTGLYRGTLRVTLRLETLKGIPAQGHGRDGTGSITFDVDHLARYARRTREFERLKRAGGKVVVPPALMEGIAAHELTHAFQGARGPAWYREGMAAYVAQDPHFVHVHRKARLEVGPIDGKIDPKGLYARGWAFFEYLEAQHSAKACRRFIELATRDGLEIAEAAGKATGTDWHELRKAEQAWSAEWMRNRR